MTSLHSMSTIEMDHLSKEDLESKLDIIIGNVFTNIHRPPVLCEWEGTPTHIVYEHPYILAIDPCFIEVRHVETVSVVINKTQLANLMQGELVQIISGENIRLAYYNGGGDKPVIHVCMTHSQKPDTQALFHLLLNSNHRNSFPRRA